MRERVIGRKRAFATATAMAIVKAETPMPNNSTNTTCPGSAQMIPGARVVIQRFSPLSRASDPNPVCAV